MSTDMQVNKGLSQLDGTGDTATVAVECFDKNPSNRVTRLQGHEGVEAATGWGRQYNMLDLTEAMPDVVLIDSAGRELYGKPGAGGSGGSEVNKDAGEAVGARAYFKLARRL